MKKFLLAVCVALVGLCASAQEKGDMAVGLNIGAAPCLEKNADLTNFGIGAKFQYNVTNPIRVEADVDYWFKSKGCDVFDISANVHYIFKVTDKINVYPLVGIGYGRLGAGGTSDFDKMEELFSEENFGNWGTSEFDKELDEALDASTAHMNRFLFNVGVGAEYALTSKLSVGLEVKYQYMKDFNRLPITLGVAYKF